MPAIYQTTKKAGVSFWSDIGRLERRIRWRYGVLAQLHQPEVERFEEAVTVDKWISIPNWFQEWEVRQGFWAELVPPLTYIGREILRDRLSGWWVGVLRNWVVEVLSFKISDAFDTWRLWWLPPKIRDAADHLDMKRVFGVNGE